MMPIRALRMRTASVSIAYPDYAYAENLSGVAESAGTATALATISSFRTAVGSNYLVLWNSQVTGTTTSGGADVNLNIDGGGFESSSTSHFTDSSPFDQRTHCGIWVFAGDGSTHDFSVRGNRGFFIGTATFTNSSIFVLKLGPNDVYATSAPQTATSTTIADMLTISFTPPSARDYLLLGYSAMGSDNVNQNAYMELFDGTTSHGIAIHNNNNISVRHPFMIMEKLAGVSAAQTIKLRKKVTAAGTTGTFNYPYLVAIDLSRFAAVQYAALASDSAGTQTTYQTSVTQTFTPAAVPFLTLAAALIQNNATSLSTYNRFVDNGTTLTESVQAAFAMPTSALRMQTFAASSRTQTIERKSETTGITATLVGGLSAIANLSLSGLISA